MTLVATVNNRSASAGAAAFALMPSPSAARQSSAGSPSVRDLVTGTQPGGPPRHARL